MTTGARPCFPVFDGVRSLRDSLLKCLYYISCVLLTNNVTTPNQSKEVLREQFELFAIHFERDVDLTTKKPEVNSLPPSNNMTHRKNMYQNQLEFSFEWFLRRR